MGRDVVIVELLLSATQAPIGADETAAESPKGIETARPSDLAAVLALLVRVGLAQPGIASALETMVVAREAGLVKG